MSGHFGIKATQCLWDIDFFTKLQENYSQKERGNRSKTLKRNRSMWMIKNWSLKDSAIIPSGQCERLPGVWQAFQSPFLRDLPLSRPVQLDSWALWTETGGHLVLGRQQLQRQMWWTVRLVPLRHNPQLVPCQGRAGSPSSTSLVGSATLLPCLPQCPRYTIGI